MSTGDSPSAQESIMVGQMRIRYLIDGTPLAVWASLN
jgi:hypothetical protein